VALGDGGAAPDCDSAVVIRAAADNFSDSDAGAGAARCRTAAAVVLPSTHRNTGLRAACDEGNAASSSSSDELCTGASGSSGEPERGRRLSAGPARSDSNGHSEELETDGRCGKDGRN